MQRARLNLVAPVYTNGTVVQGKYRLLHLIGEGGMGAVWAAHSQPLDVNVAIKLIRLDTANEDSAERLMREARALARLADPGIVRVFDVGSTEQGDPFIVMELLVGASLQRAVEAGRIEPVRAVRLLLPIVRALECAHRAGIVHRDVKPDNILIAHGSRGDLQPKLVDFGAAKWVKSADHLTRVGSVVGSPLYMSPEQARGEAVDPRTDLWSVCAVLYEAVSGEPPFQADNTNALLHAINTREVLAISGDSAGDGQLWDIIHKGLTKDRNERWQNAHDLMLALAGWLRARGATEDITGVALQGRGLGRFSSSPSLDTNPRASQRRSRAKPTEVVLGGSLSNQQRAQLAPVDDEQQVPRSLLERVLAGRHLSPRFWSVIGATLLGVVILGIAWHRWSSAPSPRWSAAVGPTSALVHDSPDVPTAATPRDEAPLREEAQRTAEPTSPEPTKQSTAARAKLGAQESTSHKAAARPKAKPHTPAPFKNPFD